MLYLIYIALIVSFTGFFMSMYKIIFKKHLETRKRLEEIGEMALAGHPGQDKLPKTPIQRALELPIHKRVLLPIYKKLLASLEKYLPNKFLIKLEKDIAASGLSYTMTFREFMVIYFLIVVASILLGFVFLILLSVPLWLSTLLVIIGLFAPKLWLARKVKMRKEQIQKELPEFLDLMTVSVEAGLGFESSLKKVADEGQGPFALEIKKVISEISMGKSRKEALIDLKNRVVLGDLTAFINAVIQAEQLGVGISKVLKVEAKEFRRKRRQRAEEQAMKAPIKLLIPLVLFIFPAIFVILLGPSILRMMEMFMSM